MLSILKYSNCPCCRRSSSSSSSSSGSSGGCTCCWTNQNGCCGCCCVHVPPNPPYWTRELYAQLAFPCWRGITDDGPLACNWEAGSNVYVNGDFGWEPLGVVELGFNTASWVVPAGLTFLFGGVADPLFSYAAPEGFDWRMFCTNNEPVTLSLAPGWRTILSIPPAPTITVDPIQWTFTGSPYDRPNGDNNNAPPCTCTYKCGPWAFCSGICIYISVENEEGGFLWELDAPNCGEPHFGSGSACSCDQDSAGTFPAPLAPNASIAFQCLQQPST